MRPIYIALAWLAPATPFAQDAPEPAQRPVTAAGQARFEALLGQIQDLQKRHSITVNGVDNPRAMPRGVVHSMYFARFRMVDDTSFAQFALEQVGATGSDVEVLKGAQKAPATGAAVDLCADLLEGALADAGGWEVASHIVAVEATRERDTAAHYQRVIDGLSPRVRANVLQGIDEVARGLSSTHLDHLNMAKEDPALYKTMVAGYCRGNRRATAIASEGSSRDSAHPVDQSRAR